jgi:hypothetical protein
MISGEELSMIKGLCTRLGCQSTIINPRAQDIDYVIGRVDPETKEYKEGMISLQLRQAIKQKAEKYNWIIFDGKLQMNWVENMNSLLDESKKLTLVTGESLVLNARTKVIFETSDLSRCSPATISRCGLVCMNDTNVSIKGVINRFLKKLPRILNDQLEKIDKMFGYFFPDIFDKFINDDTQHQLLYPASQKFAVLNFLKLFEGFIADYRSDKFKNWAFVKNAYDMKITEEVNDEGISIPYIQRQFKYKKTHKTCFYQFSILDNRLFNSLVFKERFIESFFIQSMIWGFGSLMKNPQPFRSHVLKKVLRMSRPV